MNLLTEHRTIQRRVDRVAPRLGLLLLIALALPTHLAWAQLPIVPRPGPGVVPTNPLPANPPPTGLPANLPPAGAPSTTAAPLPAPTQHGADGLSPETWREYSFGVNLHPPTNAIQDRSNVDEALVRFLGPNPYLMTLYIKQSDRPTSPREVAVVATAAWASQFPSAHILEERALPDTTHPGYILYLNIPDEQKGHWVLGQAFVQIDARHFVDFRFEVDFKKLAAIKPVFEAVVASIAFEDPAVLEKQRSDLLARGQAFKKALDFKALLTTLQPVQYLKITNGGSEIGYMEVQQFKGKQLGVDGLRVVVTTFMQLPDRQIASRGDYFLASDLRQEFWNVVTVAKPINTSPGLGRGEQAKAWFPSKWTETGFRNANGELTVKTTQSSVPGGNPGPGGNNAPQASRLRPIVQPEDKHDWKSDNNTYMPQAALYLIEPLLLKKDAKDLAEMGLYAYFSTSGKLALRTVRVTRAADGTFSVVTRPALDQGEQITRYDANGRFIDRTIARGEVVEPTTRQHIESRWNTKLDIKN